jgi:hypothetical protein
LMGLENLQYHEGVRARWLAEKAGQHYRHPYDVGVFTNLSMVGSISLIFYYWVGVLVSYNEWFTKQDTVSIAAPTQWKNNKNHSLFTEMNFEYA